MNRSIVAQFVKVELRIVSPGAWEKMHSLCTLGADLTDVMEDDVVDQRGSWTPGPPSRRASRPSRRRRCRPASSSGSRSGGRRTRTPPTFVWVPCASRSRPSNVMLSAWLISWRSFAQCRVSDRTVTRLVPEGVVQDPGRSVKETERDLPCSPHASSITSPACAWLYAALMSPRPPRGSLRWRAAAR